MDQHEEEVNLKQKVFMLKLILEQAKIRLAEMFIWTTSRLKQPVKHLQILTFQILWKTFQQIL